MQGGKKGGGGGHVARTKVPGRPVQEDTIVQYLYKTKMCYHWQSGYCLMGNNCNFAHGIHELRIPRSFTVVNEQVRDVTPAQPDTVFNRELNPAALGPAGQRSYNRALKGFEDGRNPTGSRGSGSREYPNGAPPAASKEPAEAAALLEVQGKMADAVLGDQGGAEQASSSRLAEDESYFQEEGNHDKPFGSGFNGNAMGRGRGKPLKVKIAKTSPGALEEAESVKTPKWAGWLLDTPRDNSPRGRAKPQIPENACPMCGHVEPVTQDAGVQCDLLR